MSIYLIGISLIFIFFMYRNYRVYNYWTYLIDTVSQCCILDIKNSRPWEWRWRVLNTISYTSMLFQFWKSLDTFILDESFLCVPENETPDEGWYD